MTAEAVTFLTIENELKYLDFDELTYVSEEDWEKFHNTELTAEDLTREAELSEAARAAAKNFRITDDDLGKGSARHINLVA